jgi:hypothetical protein
MATDFDDSFAGSPANPQGAPMGVIPEPSSIGTSRTPGVFYGDGTDGEYKGRVENLFDFLLNFDDRGQAVATAQEGGFRGANSGGLSFQHVFLDDTQLEVILRAVEKTERIEEISAPRLTVYDTQRANVSVMTQNSYVQDFDVEIAQAAAIGDPIVQTIRDGIILDVRPIVSADRRFITMELRPTVADLVGPARRHPGAGDRDLPRPHDGHHARRRHPDAGRHPVLPRSRGRVRSPGALQDPDPQLLLLAQGEADPAAQPPDPDQGAGRGARGARAEPGLRLNTVLSGGRVTDPPLFFALSEARRRIRGSMQMAGPHLPPAAPADADRDSLRMSAVRLALTPSLAFVNSVLPLR